MPCKKGERIPTNLIVGFLGSGKTTAIKRLLEHRLEGENWSVLINEFGTVSIDHALVENGLPGVAVEELGGGCACCTMSFAFKPLLARFIRRTKPDRLILEPSGLSHPAKVVDILRGEDFAGAIDLRNIICLIDPKDFDDPRWQESEVFQDQVQLADIVVLNWTDQRERDVVDRCRAWVQSFNPPKQLILETQFGVIEPELLDQEFNDVRFPLFAEAHPAPQTGPAIPSGIDQENDGLAGVGEEVKKEGESPQATPRHPRRFQNDGPDYAACGWVFHVSDVFDRDRLIDFLGAVKNTIRLKGVFRCQNDWWQINRAKEATDFSNSTYRRDSRLEVIVNRQALDWDSFENELIQCLADQP